MFHFSSFRSGHEDTISMFLLHVEMDLTPHFAWIVTKHVRLMRFAIVDMHAESIDEESSGVDEDGI